MEGRKMPRKIVVEELDVTLENGGVAGRAAMEVMVIAGEGGGIAGVNVVEGELTITSQAFKMNT